MRRLLLVLAACGGGGSYPSGDCVQMSMQVEQGRGACVVADTDGVFISPLDSCPSVQWAYCGIDCPIGWSLSCQGPEPEHDCTYDGKCTNGTFDALQELNGQRGMLVRTNGGSCEFRPCR